MAALAIGETGVVKDRPAPTFRVSVALAALAGVMVRGCAQSVAALAIDKAGVVKDRPFPTLRAGVALAALAGIVVLRCAQSVTALAIGKAGVVKDRPFPTLCVGVALVALAGMVVHGCSGGVTVLAIGKAGVVEYSRTPAVGGVAGSTVYTKLAEMNVWLNMTDDALLGGLLQGIVDMALIARYLDMSASELESGQIVVKGSLLPTIGHVAPGAILPQPPVVRIGLLVARLARWIHFLISHLVVAVGAGRRHVGSGQREIHVGLVAPFAGRRVAHQGLCLLSGGMGRLAVTFFALYVLLCVNVVTHH
jgi:hypothetical protein